MAVLFNPSAGGGGGFSDPMTTRGDIIIRDATNTTARLGVGSSGQYLTSDGTDISWGSLASSPSRFDATVGSSGADYTDIQAAITGVGGTDIKLLLITDVTEDSDIAVPSGANLMIHLNSYTLTMGANQFTYSALANVYIYGNGVDSGAEIDWTPTTTLTLFDNDAYAGSFVRADGFVWDHNATTGNCRFSDEKEHISNMRVELPNQSNSGFATDNPLCIYENLELQGGGSSCYGAMVFGSSDEIILKNIIITGTWQAGTFDVIQTTQLTNVVADGIFVQTATNIKMNLNGNKSVWNNILATDGTLLIDCGNPDGASYSNFNLNGGELDVEDAINCSFTNGTMATLDLTDTTGKGNSFNGLHVTNAVTMATDNCTYNGVFFLGGVTINDGAVLNALLGCQAGATAGGGSETITDNNSANNTIIVGCRTDAAIAGTGTPQTAANVVY